MKRMVVGALAISLALSASSNVAQAAPKKKPAKTEQVREAPQSAEISKTMGELKWGASRDEVMQRFMDQIREKYKPLMAKSSGAIEEDKLRAKMRDELQRVRSSLVEFNGEKTGADASFLRAEFTHHNNESMFTVSDDHSKNYYFFMNGRLWKWYKAFEASAFNGKSFDEFASAIQDRYGKAQARDGEIAAGAGKTRWLEWQDPQTRLRAVDNKQFYGFYSLVFESKETLGKLAQLRSHKEQPTSKVNSLVESVTSGGTASAPTDSDSDVVDRITGKMRHRQEAPAASPTAAPGKTAPSTPSTPPPPSGGVHADDDPLKGLL